jgi:predicted metal-dependent hydrolase
MSSNGAKQAFKQRVRHWAKQLEVPITRLAVCPMRHKWASCSTAGRLHFSTDLLPLDQELWDLVIVHELLHLSVPNHGRLWKVLMRAHLGDWEAAAARLQRPGSADPPASAPPQIASIRAMRHP